MPLVLSVTMYFKGDVLMHHMLASDKGKDEVWVTTAVGRGGGFRCVILTGDGHAKAIGQWAHPDSSTHSRQATT
jgi:hypothetical protein